MSLKSWKNIKRCGKPGRRAKFQAATMSMTTNTARPTLIICR